MAPAAGYLTAVYALVKKKTDQDGEEMEEQLFFFTYSISLLLLQERVMKVLPGRTDAKQGRPGLGSAPHTTAAKSSS